MSSFQKCDLIFVAAGLGARFQGSIPKQFEIVNGRPLYLWSLDILLSWRHLGLAVVVVPADWVEPVNESFQILRNPSLRVVAGGATRQASVKNGLEVLSDLSDEEWLMVHDGVRPALTLDFLNSLWAHASDTRADGVIPGLPVTETIKQVDHEMFVRETLPRQKLYSIQTPQFIRKASLAEAYKKDQKDENGEGLYDDASLIERLGRGVFVVPGDRHNIKVTYQEDIERVSHWLRDRYPSV